MTTRSPAGGSRRQSRPLEGEDISTNRWEDARHWMSIYSDLLEFKRGILGRMQRDLPGLHPTAQKAAAVDLQIIETQMLGYQQRLDLWFARIWELQGLQLDAEDRMVRHRGRDVTLTKREFQLLHFLLEHPHRYFTTTQILKQALYWRQSYTEIWAMEEKVLDRIRQLMARQSEAGRREVELTNVPVVVAQAEKFRQRLGYWEARIQQLDGDSPGTL